MGEILISSDAWISIEGLIAQVNEASRSGKDYSVFLVRAGVVLGENGLGDVLTVEEIPYAEGKLFRLSGLDGHGYSYSIRPQGVIFEDS